LSDGFAAIDFWVWLNLGLTLSGLKTLTGLPKNELKPPALDVGMQAIRGFNRSQTLHFVTKAINFTLSMSD